MRQKLLLVAAVFFGALAFFLMYQQIRKEKEKALRGSREVALLAAKTDLIAGETLTRDKLVLARTRRFVSQRTAEIDAADLDRVLGKTLAFNVRSGSVLYWQDIAGYGTDDEKGLSGIIAMGQRAISIPVDSTSSVTNLVRPNNHVDIIGTFRFPALKGDQELDTITLTLLQRVTILATGKELAKSFGTPVTRNYNRETATKQGYGTVTLAVSPQEAELLIFATQKGRLDLSLRNFEDTGTVKTLKSVNFKYLQEHLEEFNKEREKTLRR